MPPGIRRHPWRLLALLLCLLSSLATPALAGVSEAHDEFASLIEDSLTELSAKRGPTDPQYFSGGVWRSGDPGCWSCQVGPATAAAALWRENRSDFHRWLAVTTFDTAIRRFRMRNGSFGRADDSPDIATMFFGLELGHSYLLLEPSLERARARRWRAALAGGADFLIANGNVHWYTNGNINLGNTTLFYLAWRATGHKRFIDAYEESWRFLLEPSPSPLAWIRSPLHEATEGRGRPRWSRIPRRVRWRYGRIRSRVHARAGRYCEQALLALGRRAREPDREPHRQRRPHPHGSRLDSRHEWRDPSPDGRSQGAVQHPGSAGARRPGPANRLVGFAGGSARANRFGVSRRSHLQPPELLPRTRRTSRRCCSSPPGRTPRRPGAFGTMRSDVPPPAYRRRRPDGEVAVSRDVTG